MIYRVRQKYWNDFQIGVALSRYMPRPRAFEHIFVLVFCRFSKNLKLLALMIFDLWYSKEGKTWLKKAAFVTLNFFVQNIIHGLKKS